MNTPAYIVVDHDDLPVGKGYDTFGDAHEAAVAHGSAAVKEYRSATNRYRVVYTPNGMDEWPPQ